MTTSKATVEALDATAGGQDDAAEVRPATPAERNYLVARVADLEAAVPKIEAQIAGLKESLKSAKADLAEARRAQKVGAE